MVPLLPFALLPGDVGWMALALVVALGAAGTVRLLHLPWWWLLFPPLVQSVISGNVQSLLVPLVLLGTVTGSVAGLLKIYAAVPLVILGRWRSVLVLGVLLAVTAPLLPWGAFFANAGLIGERLSTQNENGLPAILLIGLAPVIVVALWVVGRERAAWLAVPACWPAQQFYYGTLVMPARSKVAAAIVAIPVAGSGLAALFVVALLTWREARSGPAQAIAEPALGQPGAPAPLRR
jgi:hypothetical protein